MTEVNPDTDIEASTEELADMFLKLFAPDQECDETPFFLESMDI